MLRTYIITILKKYHETKRSPTEHLPCCGGKMMRTWCQKQREMNFFFSTGRFIGAYPLDAFFFALFCVLILPQQTHCSCHVGSLKSNTYYEQPISIYQ